MRRILIFAGTFGLLCWWLGFGSSETAASRDSDAEAEKLLKQAEELTDIRSNGAHPFRLTAHLQRGPLRQHVDICGIIGTDGQWHNLAVVKSAGKEVDSYWLKAMAIPRYLPARCGGSAIEEESVTEFYVR